MRSAVYAAVTCPRIVNVLAKRYLKDFVFGEAYNGITAAPQPSWKREEELGTELKSNAEICSGIFNEHFFINCLLLGLLPTTVAVIAAQVHWLPQRYRVNFSVMRRLAEAERKTDEARADAHRSFRKGAHFTTKTSRRLSTINR